MTTTTTPADYLAELPPPIQAQLVDIARTAIGADSEEKGYVVGASASVALDLTGGGSAESLPFARMVSALGLIGRLAHEYSKKEATRG